MENVDTLICAAHVIPVEPRAVLAHHAVAIRDGRIVALAPTDEALARFEAREVVRLDRHVLFPGLVNLHCHAAMALLRGLADDRRLMEWLEKHIWPAEARHVSDEFVHDGSLLAMAEMLRAGVTCVNDMYFFPEATARAALRAGMRAALGIIAVEFPSAYAADPQEYLEKGLATRDGYRGETLLAFCLAPHAPYTVGDETMRRIAVLSEELDIPIHTHVHETIGEIEQGLARNGMRPVERLRRLGVVGPRLVAVHCVHLDEPEIELFARENVSVAHCPSSNMKLASGIAPVPLLRMRGVNVGLGTDGAASNNRLDVLTEMRNAALLAKVTSGDAAMLGALEAIEMATLAGARALGLDDRIGSIVPGKSADLAAIALDSVETMPCFDPASHMVYAAGREHVTHAWVEGRARLAERRLVGLDERDLRDKAAWWQRKMA
ncbi:MAG TPA: TRZ/ATZ family hydrolase [Usitatibacter sp.]|jgi:5-methylthioadenosine/S-adenosylhomocysteine deaminase